MKKIFLFTLVFGITLVSWNPALAKKEAIYLLAPTGLFASIVGDSVCFTWDPDPVGDADKYSIDVEVGVDVDIVGDGVADMVVEFSFGTADRTDDGDPSEPNLCVPLADFAADLDEDGTLEPLSGPASAKSSRWQKIADIPEDDFEAHNAEPAPYPTFIPRLFFNKNGLNFLF